jgi:bifunctional DNase/RNase
VRTETPIYVAEDVLDRAGIVPHQPNEVDDQPGSAEPRVEVDESKLSPFKEFIDTLDFGDLDPGSEHPS